MGRAMCLLGPSALLFGLTFPAAAQVVAVDASAGAAASSNGNPQDVADLRRQIAEERDKLDEQQRTLDAQRARLASLERVMVAKLGPLPSSSEIAASPGIVPLPPSPPATADNNGPVVPTVGEAPTDQRQVQVAALAEQGGIITRAGQLTLEADLEYGRADRNRVVFREE